MWILEFLEEVKDEETWYGKIAILGIACFCVLCIVGAIVGLFLIFIGIILSGWWPLSILFIIGLFVGLCIFKWMCDGI